MNTVQSRPIRRTITRGVDCFRTEIESSKEYPLLSSDRMAAERKWLIEIRTETNRRAVFVFGATGLAVRMGVKIPGLRERENRLIFFSAKYILTIRTLSHPKTKATRTYCVKRVAVYARTSSVNKLAATRRGAYDKNLCCYSKNNVRFVVVRL